MGVWIEIEKSVPRILDRKSLPAWECGLKFSKYEQIDALVGRHSLRGSVD